jgi:transglutaminase-like putative cysteine protease
MLENLTFLESGAYTRIDDKVLKITSDLRNSSRPVWETINKYLIENLTKVTFDETIFRKRTASQILESKKSTGCTDTALAFIVLARGMNLPTKYVETFDEQWLINNSNMSEPEGHIFVDIYVDGKWRIYAPKKTFILGERYSLNGRPYIEAGKGLDFSHLYLKENGVYKPEPTKIQSLDDLARLGKSMREKVN